MKNKLFKLKFSEDQFKFWDYCNYDYIKHSKHCKFRLIYFNVFGIRLDYLK